MGLTCYQCHSSVDANCRRTNTTIKQLEAKSCDGKFCAVRIFSFFSLCLHVFIYFEVRDPQLRRHPWRLHCWNAPWKIFHLQIVQSLCWRGASRIEVSLNYTKLPPVGIEPRTSWSIWYFSDCDSQTCVGQDILKWTLFHASLHILDLDHS